MPPLSFEAVFLYSNCDLDDKILNTFQDALNARQIGLFKNKNLPRITFEVKIIEQETIIVEKLA